MLEAQGPWRARLAEEVQRREEAERAVEPPTHCWLLYDAEIYFFLVNESFSGERQYKFRA